MSNPLVRYVAACGEVFSKIYTTAFKETLRTGVVATTLLSAGFATAATPGVGDAAPDFELPGSDGELHRLSDLRGKYVVLAFFPKAFTGG